MMLDADKASRKENDDAETEFGFVVNVFTCRRLGVQSFEVVLAPLQAGRSAFANAEDLHDDVLDARDELFLCYVFK